MTGTAVDLSDPELYGDDESELERALAELRRGGVARTSPGSQADWVIGRHADIDAALAQPTELSSEFGNMLRIRPDRDPAAGDLLTITDPPRHEVLRTALHAAMAARSKTAFVENARRCCERLIDAAEESVTLDFARDVADRLPIEVTCDLIGVPTDEREDLVRWSLISFAAEDADLAGGATADLARTEANSRLLDYFFDKVELARRRPGDDLVGRLLAAERGRSGLTPTQVVLSCFNLLLGGFETTRSSAAGGVLALEAHPEQWQRICAQPKLVAKAVEEIIRWTTPIRQVLRRCTVATVVGGQPLEPGDVVGIWLASANRDEAAFERPELFRIDRTPNRHLSFGSGPHHCIGKGIARLELKALFGELARRRVLITTTGPVRRVRSPFLAAYKCVPVRIGREW